MQLCSYIRQVNELIEYFAVVGTGESGCVVMQEGSAGFYKFLFDLLSYKLHRKTKRNINMGHLSLLRFLSEANDLYLH